jgi:uncharacterized protein YbaR (Trm112 family)
MARAYSPRTRVAYPIRDGFAILRIEDHTISQ